jgi:type IV pilus assembly protein PilY1
VIRRGSLAIALAVLHGLQMPVTARADPDEAWLHRAELPAGVQPLLVLILDRSEAAARSVLAAPGYNPAQDYGASLPPGPRCERGRVYWRRGPGPAPDCATQAGLDAVAADATRAFHCDTARAALTRQGYFVASRAAQWHEDGRDGRWTALDPGATGAVECRADRARHGAAPGTWYAADGSRGPWSAAAVDEIRWDRAPLADPYVFYLGNYLNYLRAPGVPREIAISELARQSLAGALRATDGIEAALLRFAAAADRAYVSRAAVPAAALATDLEATAEDPMDSGAPLAEALAEAAAWLAGGHVHSGEGVAADPRAFDAATGDYVSPFVHACRPITVAYATAGEPSGDESAADAAAALPGFVAATGGCGSDCLGTLARFIAGSDLRSTQAGRQSAPLWWLAPAPAAPAIAASPGGAPTLRVEDPHAYVELIAHAHQHDTAVPAGPALSAAGLMLASAAVHEAAVFHGFTAPHARQRWLGNLFRYGMRAPEAPLSPPVIVDRDGDPAIDARSGLPLAGSRSAWSESPDSDLLAGGANGRLPVPSERRVFADLATGDITDARNRVMPGNALLSRHVVGLGSTDPEAPEDVIAWLLEARPIGDPGLHAPRVVGNQEDLAVVFTATQDGLLHAFDAHSGIERWAWMPRALLSRLAGLMRDEATTARGHGIDGPLVVHRLDPDGDGAIDTLRGEHHWLLFGLGRGGNAYYALDIADPDRPRLLWTQEGAARRGAEAKAEPVVARLSTGDPGQSAGDWIVMRADAGTLQVLDAETGRSLWSAGAAGEPELALPGLTGTFASAPRVLDLDGDGRIDRAYLVDTSGGLWRLDFVRADSPAELASARRIARLGDGSQRFQASPDVSIVRLQGRREIALAIGSGRIDRPREVAAVDRVYVVFDRGVERELAESDLHDASDRESAMPPSAPGWYLRLDRHGAGEKVVSPGLTFDHVLRFQTYEPLPQAAAAPCGPPRAMHRRYARDVRTGMPATRVERPEDREELEIEAEGLPPALRYAFPAAIDTPCDGCRARPFGIVGPHIFDPGFAGDPVRTSWRKLPLPDSR